MSKQNRMTSKKNRMAKRVNRVPARLWLAIAAMPVYMIFQSQAHAGLGGYPVIYVHGYYADQVGTKAQMSDLDEDEVYLRVKEGGKFLEGDAASHNPVVNHTIQWSSAFRLQEEVAQHVFRQMVELQQQGVCDEGCIFLSVSGGDLVTRYALENQDIWFEQYNRDHGTNLKAMQVIATLDIVGAGGGTTAATLGVWAAQGNSLSFLDEMGLRDQLGELLGLGDNISTDLGFTEDLTLAAARNVATDYAGFGIPRLRVSASKGMPLLSEVLVGADDGLVEAHSSCGAQAVAALESCSNHVAYDGSLGSFAGPGSGSLFLRKPKLLPNYYPIIMSDDYTHWSSTDGTHGGKATFIKNGFSVNGINFDVEEESRYSDSWFFRRKTHQWVAGSEQKSLTEVVVDALGGATYPYPAQQN